MRHATRAQLKRFVSHQETNPDFEAHLDACQACAVALQRRAERACQMSPPSFRRWPQVFAVMAACTVALLWPQPTSSKPLETALAIAHAGVPDAGVVDAVVSPVMLASNDAGGMARPTDMR